MKEIGNLVIEEKIWITDWTTGQFKRLAAVVAKTKEAASVVIFILYCFVLYCFCIEISIKLIFGDIPHPLAC